MKYFYLLFGLIPALLAGNPAFAQISIDEVDAKEDKVTFQDKLKSTSVDVDYFSLARYKAERAAIRKERNYLEFSGGIQDRKSTRLNSSHSSQSRMPSSA